MPQSSLAVAALLPRRVMPRLTAQLLSAETCDGLAISAAFSEVSRGG